MASLMRQWRRSRLRLLQLMPIASLLSFLMATTLMWVLLVLLLQFLMVFALHCCFDFEALDFLSITQVGDRGLQLSGGQKQRIAIARAMLKNPKLLLLDEATSALDAGSESIVQEALDRLMVGRTTVVVAHRLSTIRCVDMIAVIQQGQVVETGTHDELLAKGSSGAYAALIRFQETARNRACPSTRKSRSSRLSNSLSTRSLSLRSGSLRNLSYSYSTGADGRIEMVSNADNDRKYPAPRGYFFKLLKLNAPEWPYTILGAVGSVLSGFIGPTFAIVMSNMIEVFYYRNPSKMESKTREYVFIYIGTGLYAVVAYLVQHYFFSIMGENLTTRVRRMMLAVILRNDVGWFDQEENNSNLVAARLSTDAADVKSAIAERISVILQNMTSLLVSFVVGFIIEWRVALLILVTFPLLVLANFAQGRDGATEEEVVEAAKVANVHGFVSALPDGYRTPVGERGVQLSGGQKQRIAIARAVLKDPAVLLLDEATSALDAESECVLQEALERIMKGRTAVLVAHRLSTIRGVDSIAVVQDGRVVEQGSHGDLVSRPDGAYSRLLQLQLHHG
ncbi:ABC transporter B family member 19 [Zea mays]|uniref:ABC transporter B family member 19 n=1 Tax=Zea mays TaxID=4577 RepID=A0A1D6J803_MAIZE|nr:ABC transporter B family member 19 [Zea mays]